MNKVTLIGRLTADPEARYTASGAAIVNFTLAVNERVPKGDGTYEDRPSFLDCQAFGKQGEAFAKAHYKGDLAAIDGKLRQERWVDKQSGAKRSRIVVNVQGFDFLKPKAENRVNQEQPGMIREAEADFDDTPF